MEEQLFPQLESERLIFNQPTEDDVKLITEILSNEVYSRNTTNIPFPYSEKDARFWIDLACKGFKNREQYIFAIRTAEDKRLIGGIDLGIDSRCNKAELGYWLDEKYWNQGFATEATKCIIKFGFEQLHLKRIYATHFEANLASGEVMKKAGMKKEGVLRCHTLKNGDYKNHVLYAIINE